MVQRRLDLPELPVHQRRPKLRPSSFTPVAGDVIKVSVSQTATATKVTVKDVTQNLSQIQNGTGGTDDNSNVWRRQ